MANHCETTSPMPWQMRTAARGGQAEGSTYTASRRFFPLEIACGVAETAGHCGRLRGTLPEMWSLTCTMRLVQVRATVNRIRCNFVVRGIAMLPRRRDEILLQFAVGVGVGGESRSE